MTLLSSLAEIMISPVFEYNTALTEFLWPLSVYTQDFEGISHIFIVLSDYPVTIFLPQGLKSNAYNGDF